MKLSAQEISAIHAVKKLIDKEFYRDFTQPALAYEFHISETKLRKGFQQVFEKNIYEYQIFVRVHEAKSLLETTPLTVRKIAGRVGYDVRNLAKQFKKLMGVSMNEWRKKGKAQKKKVQIPEQKNRNRPLLDRNLPIQTTEYNSKTLSH